MGLCWLLLSSPQCMCLSYLRYLPRYCSVSCWSFQAPQAQAPPAPLHHPPPFPATQCHLQTNASYLPYVFPTAWLSASSMGPDNELQLSFKLPQPSSRNRDEAAIGGMACASSYCRAALDVTIASRESYVPSPTLQVQVPVLARAVDNFTLWPPFSSIHVLSLSCRVSDQTNPGHGVGKTSQ